MKKSYIGLFLLLLIPVLVWAATPPLDRTAEPAATPLTRSYSEYNDGWVDVFKVPITGPDERDRSTLDVFDSTFFLDAFEGDCTAWVAEDLTDVPPPFPYWHLDDTLALGGSGLAWYAGDTTTFSPPGYADHQLHYLISDTLDLTTAASPISLAFKARWKIEDPGSPVPPDTACDYNLWDTWNVWASTDLGQTWAVISPTSPAYTNTRSYAFGSEFEMGCDIPGWGGEQATYTECLFSLNALAGQDCVLIRWAFCADPGFSSIDDATLYGVVVDSIRVTDASRAVLLSNDGEAGEFTSIVGFVVTPPSGLTWFKDATTFHSADTCWTATVDTSMLQSITSPSFVIPVGYDLVRARYWVWCDMQDTDGDLDDFIDDYYDLWLEDVDSNTVRRIVYDYGADFYEDPPGGNSLNGWVRRSIGLTTGGAQTEINLTAWAGREVRLLIRQRTDDNDDGGVGTGLHIDDVEVYATRAYQTDMASRNFNFPFPTSVGLTQSYNYNLYNAGINLLGNQLRHRLRFYRPNGVQWFDSLIVTSGTLGLGRDTTLYRNWTPTVTGSHRMWVYATYSGDEDHTNDTTRTPTNVPLNSDSNLAITVTPAGQYELAYHPRMLQSGFLNPRYIRYTPLADGVPADSAAQFDITTVKVVWQFEEGVADSSATGWIEFWSDSLPEYPGHLLKRFEVEIDTSETMGAAGKAHWWTLDVSNTPELTGLSGNFWVSLTPKDSINNSPAPRPMGMSVDPVVYDGHHFVIRLDSVGTPLMPSPGRYLVQTTIVPTRMPERVDDVVARRDGITNNVILDWTAAVRATGYKVYRFTIVSQHYTQGTLLTPVPITTNTYTDVNVIVDPAVRYFYQVIAVN